MKKAAIDIGTNSTRILIAEVNDKVKRIKKITTITRLGKDVDRNKMLNPESINKNIITLLEYKKIAESYGINSIKTIATSAVRDALNKQEFVSLIKEKTGIDINIISGYEEAELGFIGATSDVDDAACAVIDIGGGSTELVVGTDSKIEFLDSLDIGAVRITERFLGSDKIDVLSMNSAKEYIKYVIKEAVGNIKNIENFKLVGIGGTITTLAAIDQKLVNYDFEKVHGYILKKTSIDNILNELSAIDLKMRKNIPGLQPERADIITAGVLILKLIMEELEAKQIVVSENDNLEGLLIKYN